MKRLIKKSDLDNTAISKNVIISLLEKDNVKKHILKDVEDFARGEFEFNNEIDADTCLENYRDALNLDMNDIIEYLIEDIIEAFEQESSNMGEDEIEEFAYSNEFKEMFIEELFEKLITEMISIIDIEKEDADEMYGNN